MGLFDDLLARVRSWASAEAADARELSEEVSDRWNADLDRKEAELTAGPSERIEMLQADIEANNDAFDNIRSKLDPPQGPDDQPSS